MDKDLFDYVIIGAGFTGLTLAWKLSKKLPRKKIQLLEKSRGCGGRMATRRIGPINFDHGAQFLKITEESQPWIDLLQKEDISRAFPYKDVHAICGKSGITQLAKYFAKDLNISYECRATTISQLDSGWEVSNENGQTIKTQNLLLTSPLPQSIEILKDSCLSFDPRLLDIKYSKAVVVLIESDTEFSSKHIYQENVSEKIFSISAQHHKGNSPSPAWTVVMSPDWSEKYYEFEDSMLLQMASKVIQSQIPTIDIKIAHLKKWRYSQPLNTWENYFESPHQGLYLAGDAFGGGSLVGALRSSEALFTYLKNR